MKTRKQLIEKHYKLDTDEEGNAVMYLGQIENLLLEYGKEVLKLASEKAEVDYDYVFNGDEDLRVVSGVDRDSILNLINELK